MSAHQQATPAPQPITPEPVRMQIDVETIPTSQGAMVLVRIRTYSGEHVFFFVPDEARALASIIAKTAAMAATGLIIPNGVIPGAQDPEDKRLEELVEAARHVTLTCDHDIPDEALEEHAQIGLANLRTALARWEDN